LGAAHINCVADLQKVTSSFGAQDLNSPTDSSRTDTINTSLQDTGTVLSVVTSEPLLKNIYPLPDQTPKEMLQRLVALPPGTWGTAAVETVTGPLAAIDPWYQLLQNQTISDILKYYVYFRSDVEFQFRLNTNSFYSGRLMISQTPGPATYIMSNYMSARSWLKPKIVSAQSQDTVKILLPWVDPQRFVPIIATTGEAPFGPWTFYTVFLDILSRLNVASSTAPSSISYTIACRFVNPQVVVPFNWIPAAQRKSLAAKPGKEPKAQSSIGSAPPIGKPRGRTVTVRKIARAQDPVADANSPAPTFATSLGSTITSGIADVGDAVEGVASFLQPFLRSAESLAGLFDKPNIRQGVDRIIDQPGYNLPSCDVPDSSIPLALYGTSYLATGKGLLPDHKDWTMRDIAMTPSCVYLTQISNTSPTLTFLLQPRGPACIPASTHLYWRGSHRLLMMFSASSFVSGRILFTVNDVYTAAVTSPTFTGTISHVVDVKGDTNYEFTIPFWNNREYLAFGASSAYLTISVETTISSSDASTDAVIGLNIWQAMGPDCQFSSPVQAYAYNPYEVFEVDASIPRAQMDVQSEFTREFAPFVDGCEYMTDSHYTMAETTDRVVDVLKRYVTCQNQVINTNQSLTYDPSVNSIHYLYHSSFLFRRGGVNYKAIVPRQPAAMTNTSPTTAWWGMYDGTDGTPTVRTAQSYGAAIVIQSSSQDELGIALPWFANIPYAQSNQLSADFLPTWDRNSAYNNTTPVGVGYGNLGTNSPIFLTCVRDDYALGYLVPPPIQTTPRPTVKKHLHAKAPPPPPLRQRDLLEFEVLKKG